MVHTSNVAKTKRKNHSISYSLFIGRIVEILSLKGQSQPIEKGNSKFEMWGQFVYFISYYWNIPSSSCLDNFDNYAILGPRSIRKLITTPLTTVFYLIFYCIYAPYICSIININIVLFWNGYYPVGDLFVRSEGARRPGDSHILTTNNQPIHLFTV